MSVYDQGPVYYREIQKNAYLKRIPNDSTNKLRQKKPPSKPMWTLLCVHNGRTPYLEQYPEPDSSSKHNPTWWYCLKSARHVTASVKPHVGEEYDFLIDTDHGPVRMLAPDWDAMQDWVSILRSKLHELRILTRGENVYGAPPVAPPVRAAARDPTSPLPPTPPVPIDRVPGIDLTPITRTEVIENPETAQTSDTPPEAQPDHEPPNLTLDVSSLLTSQGAEVDISNWEPFSVPSTSRDLEPKKGVAKICGQNICLDDSLFKRNVQSDEDDDDDINYDEIQGDFDFKQRVVVNNGDVENNGDPQRSNITVIQVSNKGPPHTAIPVLGPEVDVFDFEFKQNLQITEPSTNFVNIVNTETTNGNYGTVFQNSDYGHISLTTTVSLTGQDTKTDVKVTPVNDVTVDGVYERLCLASTSNRAASPLPVRKIKLEKVRKSSLPNLDQSDYECLFPSSRTQSDQNGVSDNVTSEVMNQSPSNELTRINVTNLDRGSRSNIERTRSQNAYDVAPRREGRREHSSPKREVKIEKTEPPPKPIWKRGLTELSLLSRLRGIAQNRRQESPTRHEEDRCLISPAKVVHRSRPAGRVDSSRRRSNSLTNHQPSLPVNPGLNPPNPALQPLRARQAASLLAEQRRGACIATSVPVRDAPLLCDYDGRVWVARWGCARGAGGRAGDALAGAAGRAPSSLAHARELLKSSRSPRVDILFHRVPLGKMFVINKMDNEKLGIKLDSECTIVSVDPQSCAGRCGLPATGRWAVTEVNNRPINLIKGGEEEMNRLASHGTEVSILIQPAALVKKIRATLKSNKPLLGMR